MAKTSTIDNKLEDSEVILGDGAGFVVLIKQETNKENMHEFYNTLEEAQTAKSAWDD